MFTPLYVYSEYSILKSMVKINEALELATSYGYTSLAICDYGSMHGVLKFYKKAKELNIKPIIGCVIPVLINNVQSDIILYCLNNNGYQSLNILSSTYMINKKPLDILSLKNYCKDLLCIIPGEDSLIYDYYKMGQIEDAKDYYDTLKVLFDKVYIGITCVTPLIYANFDRFYNFVRMITPLLCGLSKVLYLSNDDVNAYLVLSALKNGSYKETLPEKEVNCCLYNVKYYKELFGKYSELIDNTNYIASLCNVTFTFDKYQLPLYGIESPEKYLIELSNKGLQKRFIQDNIPTSLKEKYLSRLNLEISTISKMGFVDYFLIVYDYIKYAKNHNIMVGPGRGSAGASLVAYTLGITDIDPIKYDLLFERFLNSERISMPDIDIDFRDDLRDEVIKYVALKYSKNNVAQISTFGTYKLSIALQDTARVLNIPKTHLNETIKQIQKVCNDHLINMPDAKLSDIINEDNSLTSLMKDYEDIERLVTISSRIQGLPRSLSTHPAGVIVSRYPLINFTALTIASSKDIYQTQLDASDLESLGLLKMDFLALKNITNIANTIDKIKQDFPSFNTPKEENDHGVYEMLRRGDVLGVFQLESSGMRNLIMNLEVNCFDDLVIASALYRPGPMDQIPEVIKRKKGLAPITYPHPLLKDLLKDTYGMIVYQEQIMKIATYFAGYSLGQADVLRRAVSKKKLDVLKKEESRFISSSVACGYDASSAKQIYDTIVKFANYGFNKAHSVAYSKVSYLTAFLKLHYPAYYLSTLLSSSLGSSVELFTLFKEAKKFNVDILPVSINKSMNDFIVVDNKILLPLQCVYGLGVQKASSIIEERKSGVFTSYYDFIKRCKNFITPELLINLSYAGAFNEFGITIKGLVETAELHIKMLDFECVPGMKKITYSQEEYPYLLLYEKEKEVLGLNVRFNIFKLYESLYKTNGLIKINQIKNNSICQTLGIISSIKEITTKSDKKMAFATLSDEDSFIDLTFFSKTYERYFPLDNNVLCIVRGNVEASNQTFESGSKLKILVSEIQIIK